jgi:hypothetical protein
MVKRILLAMFSLMFLLSGWSALAFQTETQTATVKVRYLNVRQEPDRNGAVLAVIRAGETYAIIGQSGTWWQIQVENIIGYVDGQFVTVNNSNPIPTPTMFVPVVSPPIETDCPTTLFFNSTPLDVCAGPAMTTQASYQTYEHGFMIWLANSGDIWAFEDGHQSPWFHFYQGNYGGLPDTASSAPGGLVQPINGFGRVWGNEKGFNSPKLKDELGWATAPEVSYTSTWQFFGRTSHIHVYMSVPDGRVADAYSGLAGYFWSFVQQ